MALLFGKPILENFNNPPLKNLLLAPYNSQNLNIESREAFGSLMNPLFNRGGEETRGRLPP
jgi:hypothetical protein